MTEAGLFDVLRPFVAAATGLSVIEDHPGAPRPVGPYVMLNVIGSGPDQPGAYDIEFEEIEGATAEPVAEKPALTWVWTVSVNAYASDAGDRLRRLTSWIASPSALLRISPLTFGLVSPIRRLPELIDGRWEGRAQMDITVRGLVTEPVPIDVVEEASVALGMARNVAVPTPPMDEDEPVGIAAASKP